MTATTESALTKEEKAWLMKALWAALQAPDWASQSPKELKTLGEALHSGKALDVLPENDFKKIFPHLITVTEHLGRALKERAEEGDSTEAPPAPVVPAVPAPQAPAAASSQPAAASTPPAPTAATTPHLSVVPTATSESSEAQANQPVDPTANPPAEAAAKT